MAAAASTSTARVGDLAHHDLVVVHRHHPLTEARTRLQAAAAPGIAVVDGDRVVAVVAAAELEGLIDDLGEAAHLRDGVASGLRFCRQDDAPAVASATMDEAGTDLIAVVDDHRRLVALLARNALGDVPPDAAPRPPIDPSDRSGEEHPRLEVYAPWAVVEE